ncbi:alpha/beta hydrolase [Mesorhizobium sp. WSM3859]|uniref:alpha/beta fold hydrolase n=1 Tax=Mesorhizobium sp. WSM3859 TaxID=2029402 RepID=UPI000BAF530C|nr:alpha/beta hydrolase [Mesorhizobium sp. WSM3859]PBC06978.1 alpha/beta hydrolase [Mesorhizobium sp. WSM3859]
MTAKSRKNLLLLLAATTTGLALYNNLLARRALGARLRGRFIYLGGTKLHFLEAGNGQPLLLLHGNGASAEDFTTSGIFEKAAARYRVLAFDRPGFGMSTRPAGRPWTAAAQADLIDAAVAKLGIERYMVVCHSWGAAVALEMARRHPRSVAGVVVVAGYHYPSPRLALAVSAVPAVPLLGTVLRHAVLPSLVRLNWNWAMKKIFHPATTAMPFSTATRGLASRPSQLRSISAESFLMLASALFSNRRYADIAVPVGIIAGAGDQLFDAKAEALRLRDEVSHSLLDIVPDAGHMVHQSNPKAILAMIDKVAALANIGDMATQPARTIGLRPRPAEQNNTAEFRLASNREPATFFYRQEIAIPGQGGKAELCLRAVFARALQQAIGGANPEH